jgi:hypothetical protein
MRLSLFVLGLAIPTMALATPETVEGPVKMKPSEIRAYNALLKPTDPAYIVCLKSAPTGSIILRTTCRTRNEWERLAQIGNDDALAWVNDARTRQFSISEEPAGSIVPLGGGNN